MRCANLASACQAALIKGLRPSDIDLVVAHQANLRIVEAVAQRLGAADGEVFINIDKYGNTSSASVPIALMKRCGPVRCSRRSAAVLRAGGGLAWGAACVRW